MSDGYGNPPQPHQQPSSPDDPGARHGHSVPPAAAGDPAQQPYPLPGQQWGGQAAHAEPFGGASSSGASTWLALGALVAIVVSVSVKESSRNGWDDYALWSGFAIACAAALLAPAARNSINLSENRAWQVAAGGAAGLAFYWILFVLPAISRNVSFVATIGVVAAGLSVWAAPGRPVDGDGGGSTW